MPQVRCPNCGTTINLESRREIDCRMIIGALRRSPRTFTDLLNLTGLPRKTLSLRLKALCDSGIVLKDGGYRLNGSAHPKMWGNGMISRENGSLRKHPLLTRKNVLLMLMMVLIGLPIAYRVSATFFTAPPPPSPPQSPELLGTFEMNIVILDATDLYAWQAMVYFNTSELEVVDVVEGDFLKANAPNGTVFTFNDDTNRPEEPTWGRLFVGGDLIGKTSGASGNGTLATITFGYKSEDYELPKLVFDDKVFDTIHVQHDLETSTGTLELEPQSQP